MNTELKLTTFTMPCQDMNGVSSLPAFQKLNFWHRNGDSGLSEDDELFIGYGHVPSPFPYKMQDMYYRELRDTVMNAVVLENEYLKAVFLPEWGGKLYSLFDKVRGRDLLFTNPVMRPCNLALRNAWTSGGVEWNCGIFGHNVHTCSTLFTTTTHLDDGTPVLRMYEYERIRGVVKQLDFFLPEGSKVLFARNRIINPQLDIVPMYWWSNIAVPETPDTRVVVNADSTYVADNNTTCVPIPIYKDVDVTYSTNCYYAGDYFYNIPPRKRKFEAAINGEGFGFIHSSTYRLLGRKLFVWGQSGGGHRWQEYLTKDGSKDRYIELQAGIAHTQYECIPMPPKTTWEWLETYGAITADKDKVHGEWKDAKAEVLARLDDIITEERLDEILEETKPMAKAKADGELLFRGEGWCALENIRRKKAGAPLIAEHLDFGEIGEEQADWIYLLEHNCFPTHSPEEVPVSYMLQPDWTYLVEKTTKGGIDTCNWYAHLQLGLIYVATNKLQEGWEELEKSMSYAPSAWALYGMATIKKCIGDQDACAGLMAKAAKLAPSDVSIIKETLEALINAGENQQAVDLFNGLTDDIKAVGRVRLYAALAHINLENLTEAEEIFFENGGIVIPDVREGESIVTGMYIRIKELRAKVEGKEFDSSKLEIPQLFDYR